MTTDPFTTAARAVGADPEEVRESMRNATEYASRNGMSDAEFILWIWHAGAIYGRDHLAAQETDGERAVRELHEESGPINRAGWTKCLHCSEKAKIPVLHPCPTIQALDSARAARRDEEKR